MNRNKPYNPLAKNLTWFIGLTFLVLVSFFVVFFLEDIKSHTSVMFNTIGFSYSSDTNSSENKEIESSFVNSLTTRLSQKKELQPLRIIEIPTIESLVPQEGKFIGANLTTMELFMYEDGLLVKTLPILSKGKPGSRWDTPSGSYEIQYKNQSHFSSIGEVYMPYSMQFYGNYFIHGWPYYPNGAPVHEGYSGGCIRLSTPDSKNVFEFAPQGTPLYVYDAPQHTLPESEINQIIPTNFATPNISAQSYVVADITTGLVFTERNIRNTYPTGSISKLMSSIVANESISYSALVPISQNALISSLVTEEIQKGERFTTANLYYPLLLTRSQSAAIAMTEYGAGHKAFILMMNKMAKALGMIDTTYTDPHGNSQENISTAHDIFLLSKYIHEKKRFIFDITLNSKKHIPQTPTAPARTYYNNNPLHTIEGFSGGIVSLTDEALQQGVSLFRIHNEGKEYTIIIIVLNSEDAVEETKQLHSWAKEVLQPSLTTQKNR
jgi:hypothetical protein